jgi:hypothetical protein
MSISENIIACHATGTGREGGKDTCKIFVEKPKGKKQLGRTGYK